MADNIFNYLDNNNRGMVVCGMKLKLIYGLIFLLALSTTVSAVAVEDNLHVTLQVVDALGVVQTGSFKFTFNITMEADCSKVLYSNTSTLVTDARGIISYYLGDTGLNYTDQYWLCWYRDDVLQGADKIARSPYTFDNNSLQWNASLLTAEQAIISGTTLSYDIIPATDRIYNLGNASYRYNTLYVGSTLGSAREGRMYCDENSLILRSNDAQIDLYPHAGADLIAHLGTGRAFRPYTNSRGSLGSSSKMWDDAFFSGTIHNNADNSKHCWGAAEDGCIYYNATDLVANPKEVGSGAFFVLGGIYSEEDIGGVSFTIGANTLNTNEWAVLDGVTSNQVIDWTGATSALSTTESITADSGGTYPVTIGDASNNRCATFTYSSDYTYINDGSYGVYSYDGTGNYGYLADSSYGVYGFLNSGSAAVYGAETSGNYGYLGDSSYGVYGYYSGGGYGHIGSSSYGVEGYHGSNYGRLGQSSYGVEGYYSGGGAGYIGGSSEGVYGSYSSNYGYLGSSSYGVYGYLSSGTAAVYGQYSSNYAYLADSSYGVYSYLSSGSAAGYFYDSYSNYAELASNGYPGYFHDSNSNYVYLGGGSASYGLEVYHSSGLSGAAYFYDSPTSNYVYLADSTQAIYAYKSGGSYASYFTDSSSNYVYTLDSSYGLYAYMSGGSAVGYFYDGSSYAELVTSSYGGSFYKSGGTAGYFYDGSTYVSLADGSYAINTANDVWISGSLLGSGSGHDQFSDFVSNEHIDWTSASDAIVTSNSITATKFILSSSGDIEYPNAGWMKFGEASSNDDIYVYDGNTLNTGYDNNAARPLWINYVGYQASTTQFRDLKIGDGKTNTLLEVTGSSGDFNFSDGDLTTTGNLNQTIGNATINMIYGEMWYHNHTATELNFAVDGTFYNLTFDKSDTNGFIFNDTDDSLEAVYSGKYRACYMASGDGQNNHVYFTTIIKNGLSLDRMESHKKMAAGGDIVTMTGCGFINLTVGDKLKLATADVGDTGTGNYYSANLNVNRIGD